MAIIVAGGGGSDARFIKGIKESGIDGIKKLLFVGYAMKKKNPELMRNFEEVKNAAKTEFGAEVLFLSEEEMQSFETMKAKADAADMIFVAGGNTLMLMNRMRKCGLDKLLIDAYYNTDKVLCGDSAGGICWAKLGNADSRFYKKDPAQKTKVRGLGLMNVLFCPHYVCDTSRQSECKRATKLLKNLPAVAFDNAAIIIKDGKYKTFVFGENFGGYKCYWKNGEYFTEEILTDEYKDYFELERI